ncbi:hypothetical protein QBC37DRAFT_289925 [Rhypophila decipiens]|uniref:Sodium/calcium exchanger membrane region domain-containing protein n=1 Tax=Rhypophila decipiens TaxID=261697 RepID=A0AAN6Y350_9PEZI|nr:hypothetical protein QBC37DRAFT_289925 [Rhypophila decipiens]
MEQETRPLLHASHAESGGGHHIASEGESGRSGFHPGHFLKVLWRSSCTAAMLVNFLWPVVPVALVVHFFPGLHIYKFILTYLAVIPTANLIGFSGQEFARKMPKVAGILIETTFGSIVEIILFVVLIVKHKSGSEEGNLIPIIQAAILGSILTNLLLCLGLCFFFGGLRQTSQKFHAIVSEVGTGLLLVAAFGLLIPSAFYSALKSEAVPHADNQGAGSLGGEFTKRKLQEDVLSISHATSLALILASILWVWFQAKSQHSIFDEVIEMDEHRDADRAADMEKPKFTMTETITALTLSLGLVTLLLILLVEQIEHVVEAGVPDQFLGLILLPLVEKAAEHITAIDEAWGKSSYNADGTCTCADGVINVALYHCLAPSIQTALFNGPLVVLLGWILGKPMDLNFEIFMVVLLVLSILVVGNFLRDGESNWLEGALLVIVYIIIAIACWYYPNPDVATSNSLNGSIVVDMPLSPDLIRQLRVLIDESKGADKLI